MIRVLVVEDTPVVRELLVQVLTADRAIQVIGTAANGVEAVEAVEQQRPDVVTMDIHMPRMNGIDATRKIMETYPTPVVMVSGSANAQETHLAFLAMEAGALAVVERPRAPMHAEYAASAAHLVQTVKLMSEVRVVRRWPHGPRTASATAPGASLSKQESRPELRVAAPIKLIAIGSSTGGPPVLQTILCKLPADLDIPVVVVQHISPGFVDGLVDWLRSTSSLPVKVASQGELLKSGTVYFAPDSLQMAVGSDSRVILRDDPPENSCRPSVSYLFRSLAESLKDRAIGVLLTGMGRDGADGLKLMKDQGGVTLVQDKESCVVFGMPAEAIQLGAANYVLAPDKMPALLAKLVHSAREVKV